jgi:hypothetical protein
MNATTLPLLLLPIVLSPALVSAQVSEVTPQRVMFLQGVASVDHPQLHH